MPGPPREALNTLHRYRDAIRDASGAQGAFARSRLHRLLDEIGVGALPMLPGATAYLDAWLKERVDEVLAD